MIQLHVEEALRVGIVLLDDFKALREVFNAAWHFTTGAELLAVFRQIFNICVLNLS